MKKIYVYPKSKSSLIETTVRTAISRVSDIEVNSIMTVRTGKNFGYDKPDDADLILTDDKKVASSMSESILVTLEPKAERSEKTRMFDNIKDLVKKSIDKRIEAPASLIEINIDNYNEVLSKDSIKKFIELFKASYKKPFIINTKDSKTIAIFDDASSFSEYKGKYDIVLTASEYIMTIMSHLAFNAKTIKLERNEPSDSESNSQKDSS